ncbi:hypothetical protein, partial [Streptomyces bambusae]|uniref:hypothetical protein n=1 Tax=Streptomyces bambusae TaxID=1550616 RepID=UPI001CA4C320
GLSGSKSERGRVRPRPGRGRAGAGAVRRRAGADRDATDDRQEGGEEQGGQGLAGEHRPSLAYAPAAGARPSP